MTDISGTAGWRARAEELAAKLAAGGELTDPLWRKAFEDTPRQDRPRRSHRPPGHRADAQFATDNSTGPCLVTQDARRLFDTVEAAWQTWQRHNRPDRTRIGITARSDGTQRAWLDSPESGTSWAVGSQI